MVTVWLLFWKVPNFSGAKLAKFAIKTKNSSLFSEEFMVDDTRLELVTSRTSSGCATSCANRPGGDKRDRTADLLNAIRHKSTVLLASSAFWMQYGCNRFVDLLKLSKKWGTRQRLRSGR